MVKIRVLKIGPADITASVLDRFWPKVTKSVAGCWEWNAYRLPNGYGRLPIWIRKQGWRNVYAHRLSYVIAKGAIPDGLTIDHLCRNPKCVNPEHLEAVSQQINTLRGVGPGAVNARKTRCNRGHEFTPENIYWDKGGRGRSCRTCAIQQDKQRRIKKVA